MISRIYPRIKTAKLQERTKKEMTSIISHHNISYQATALPLPSWTAFGGDACSLISYLIVVTRIFGYVRKRLMDTHVEWNLY
jgi:hypothetical protein